MSDEVCFRARGSGPCRDACNLLCLAENSIFPKDSSARAITKRDSFCMSSAALGSSEEFIGRCEGRISKSWSQGARPPGSGGARVLHGAGGKQILPALPRGLGRRCSTASPGCPALDPARAARPEPGRLCWWFPWACKGEGSRAGRHLLDPAKGLRPPERETASPTGAREALRVCRHHSLRVRVTAHRTLKIRLRALGRWGSQRRINTQEGVSPPSPLEIHVPVKCKAAHRGCWGAHAGEDVGGGHLSVARSHLAVTARHAQALTLEDRGHVAQGVRV